MRLPNTGIVKYHVKLKFEVDGLVEKADIIGAILVRLKDCSVQK